MTASTTNNGLVWWQSIMAALSFMASASVLSDLLPSRAGAGFLVMVGALQAGTAAYVAGTKPVSTGPAYAPTHSPPKLTKVPKQAPKQAPKLDPKPARGPMSLNEPHRARRDYQ